MADRLNSASARFPQSYHLAWLKSHPWRSEEWLREKMRDGFHIHHVDGDHSNDDPANLVLIDGTDHMALHGVPLRDGIARWRARKRKASATVKPHSREGERIYNLKVEWDCAWKELARRYHDDIKPDATKIWSTIGHGLMAQARTYAKKSARPWPPSKATELRPFDEADIAAMRSRHL